MANEADSGTCQQHQHSQHLGGLYSNISFRHHSSDAALLHVLCALNILGAFQNRVWFPGNLLELKCNLLPDGANTETKGNANSNDWLLALSQSRTVLSQGRA